jgi:hypothetical protein
MARSRAANREKYPDVPRTALTVDEVCVSAHVSRSFYEKEKREGRGAREVSFGRAIRVTPADAAAWVESLRDSKTRSLLGVSSPPSALWRGRCRSRLRLSRLGQGPARRRN